MIKIVYAGLLGVAQDLLGIIEHVDFQNLGVELHLYGGGNQKEQIERYLATHDCNVFYHGYVDENQIRKILVQYDASLIPLVTYIRGAVPSKIFGTMSLGVPMLFCGAGEGAMIIQKYGLGLVSEPGNYESLTVNIKLFSKMSEQERHQMSENALRISRERFSFKRQMDAFYEFCGQVMD